MFYVQIGETQNWYRRIPLEAFDKTSGAAITTLTVANLQILRNGDTVWANAAGTLAHLGEGHYTYIFDDTEVALLGPIKLRFVSASLDPYRAVFKGVVRVHKDPFPMVTLGQPDYCVSGSTDTLVKLNASAPQILSEYPNQVIYIILGPNKGTAGRVITNATFDGTYVNLTVDVPFPQALSTSDLYMIVPQSLRGLTATELSDLINPVRQGKAPTGITFPMEKTDGSSAVGVPVTIYIAKDQAASMVTATNSAATDLGDGRFVWNTDDADFNCNELYWEARGTGLKTYASSFLLSPSEV